MHLSKSSLIGIAVILIAALVFDPFEFAADRIYRTVGVLGGGILILTYGVVSVVRGRFAWSGHMNAALDGRRDVFWFYAFYYNIIGIAVTLLGLHEAGVFGS